MDSRKRMRGGASSVHSDFDRKLRQLCREVFRVVSETLGGLADERLVETYVLDVQPAPDGSRVRVVVCAPTAIDEVLERARPRLRRAIAEALQRKRTPELVFQVVPPGLARDGDEEELA
jgi:ribosome-binding factor A